MAKPAVTLRLSTSREIKRIVRALEDAMKASVRSGGVRYIGLPLDEGPAEELLISIDLASEAFWRLRGRAKTT